MSAWIVKGNPTINDLSKMLAPGAHEDWITKKPPRGWSAGDRVFMWKSAPALCVIGLAEIESIGEVDNEGYAHFLLRYLTGPLENPVGIAALRADPIMGSASFLKAGAAGTVFPLTEPQASQLDALVRRANKALAGPSDPNRAEEPKVALSIRQPWAELIMRGIKTIEVRSTVTHKRERVHVYAGLKRCAADEEAAVSSKYGLDIPSLPRGVIVGTVEIVDCRGIAPHDSEAAAFTILPGDPQRGWRLANPVRANEHRKPKRQPQPIFFRPF